MHCNGGCLAFIVFAVAVQWQHTSTNVCSSSSVMPYQVLSSLFFTVREYRNIGDTYVGAPGTYQWQQFEACNDNMYALGRLLNTCRSKSAAAQIDLLPIYWLNVFNSTVLRRHGHIGFGDCLHYYLYLFGPPDFWSHLLQSYICELACI